MSQTTKSLNEFVYSTTRCHDDSSNNSDEYIIVRKDNESSIEDEEDGSVEYDTSDKDQSEESSIYVSKDDLEEEETGGDDEVDVIEEDLGYFDYLIEAYDSLLSRYNSKQAVALASRVAVRRIHQGSLIQEAIKLVGKDALRKLAIIGSIQGTNAGKINKTIQVPCSGEAVKGVKTIQQLVQSDIISQKGSKYDFSNKKIHLNLIAAAMPYAAFQCMEEAQATDIARKKSKHSIETALPLQLQYLEAGSLPLGTKTRKAHLHWSFQFLESINCTFNPTIYKRNMRQAVVYENMKWLTERLDDIEGSLTLNAKENNIDAKQFFKKYYAIAQKARTKEAEQKEGRNEKTTRAERRRRRRNAARAN
ncbi:NodB homology domain-containing protein [Mucor velutinosus]|uniref:NodB homology domain-containing protein n=1 Tax=Mucor velutinosus TaxID=708070 RepID=A0AAN7HVE4_9FUNG|nr:NodB homology domain-containing protein [Mucor velutinosus]